MSTKVQEHTLLGEGLAVGCIAAGISTLPNDTSFDLDFRSAWRAWPWASHFPQVHAGPVRDDIVGILRDSARRRGPVLAWWSVGAELTPQLTADWPIEEQLEELEARTDGALPRTAWLDLARRIVEVRARRHESPTAEAG